jgi:anaerobic magnesium-protoporphyrin IX monomethyl ester cyclase
LTADVILLNPSYVYPPLPPVDQLKNDPMVMDLPSLEFMYPPVGLICMATALKKAGFAVEAIDSNVHTMTMDELAKRCEGSKVVGISLLVANLRSVYQLVQKMKGRGYEIVVGGPHPSVEPEVVAKLGLRYGISGEGEVAFTDFCRAVIRGEGKVEDIPGIIITEPDGERVFTRPPVLIEDLDSVLPDREVLRNPAYKLPFVGPIEVALSSRGCPYACPFCYCSSASPNSMFNKSRWVSIDTMVRDLRETVERYQPGYIEMIDETFTVDRGYVAQLCEAIIDQGIKFSWGAKTRVDLVDEDLLALMRRAGLRKIGFGLESGVYDLRRDMTKDFSNERVKQIFDAARRLGIDTGCTIVFGHPKESRSDMQTSVDFVKYIRADYAEFHVMVLIPKTKNFFLAVQEGKVTPDVYDRFMRGECSYPEYAPGDITAEEMRRIRHAAVHEFYFRPSYIAQSLRRSAGRPAELWQYARTAANLWAMSRQDEHPIWKLGRFAS